MILPPKKKYVTGVYCVEEMWEETAKGKRKKANKKNLLEKYKDRLFRDEVDGKIGDRTINGIL